MNFLEIENKKDMSDDERKRISDLISAFSLGIALMAVIDLIKYGV